MNLFEHVPVAPDCVGVPPHACAGSRSGTEHRDRWTHAIDRIQNALCLSQRALHELGTIESEHARLHAEVERLRDQNSGLCDYEEAYRIADAERARLRAELEAAARSLRAIAAAARPNESDDMLSVRGYANSRATVAENGLATDPRLRFLDARIRYGHQDPEEGGGETPPGRGGVRHEEDGHVYFTRRAPTVEEIGRAIREGRRIP